MSLAEFNVTVPLNSTLVLPPEFAGQEVHIVIEKPSEARTQTQPSLAEQFAGALKLSEQQYREFSESINQSRNEWNRSIY